MTRTIKESTDPQNAITCLLIRVPKMSSKIFSLATAPEFIPTKISSLGEEVQDSVFQRVWSSVSGKHAVYVQLPREDYEFLLDSLELRSEQTAPTPPEST